MIPQSVEPIGFAGVPHFVIDSTSDARDMRLHGRLTRPEAVRPGPGWLYRPNGGSSLVELLRFAPDGNDALIVLPAEEAAGDLVAGASFPYIDRYWEPDQIDMILDRSIDWTLNTFVPNDVVRCVVETPEGTQEAWFEVVDDRIWNGPIPGSLLERTPNPKASEACEICQRVIGAGGDKFAFRRRADAVAGFNSVGPWLCVDCYERYAKRHDLSFVVRDRRS